MPSGRASASPRSPSGRRGAELALLLVTLFWGLTFPLIKGALDEFDPYWFVATRFAIAAALFSPLALGTAADRRAVRRDLWVGLGLGALVWVSYITQTLGLRTVPAGRAAFITGSSTILVPLIAPLFGAGRPRMKDLAAAAIATLGIGLLTGAIGARPDAQTVPFGAGDAWILGCAVSYAFYLHALQRALDAGRSTMPLAYLQVVGVLICAIVVLPLGDTTRVVFTSKAWIALGFCALFATIGTFVLQTRYQAWTTATRTALIFAMEPVFAAVFAWLILSETIGWSEGVGAGLVLVAIVGVEMVGRRRG